LYLGIDEKPEEFEKIASGHFFYTPSKRGLGEIYKKELEEMKKEVKNKEKVYNWLERYAKYTTYEITIPSLKDKEASPTGKTGMMVSTLFDYELIDKIEKDIMKSLKKNLKMK
jgi:hypothetical protein